MTILLILYSTDTGLSLSTRNRPAATYTPVSSSLYLSSPVSNVKCVTVESHQLTTMGKHTWEFRTRFAKVGGSRIRTTAQYCCKLRGNVDDTGVIQKDELFEHISATSSYRLAGTQTEPSEVLRISASALLTYKGTHGVHPYSLQSRVGVQPHVLARGIIMDIVITDAHDLGVDGWRETGLASQCAANDGHDGERSTSRRATCVMPTFSRKFQLRSLPYAYQRTSVHLFRPRRTVSPSAVALYFVQRKPTIIVKAGSRAGKPAMLTSVVLYQNAAVHLTNASS